jgi:hypothetical protein
MANIASKLKIPALSNVIPILVVMMEVFWVYSWLIWISSMPNVNWTNPPLNLASCLLLGLFVEIIVHRSLASHWSITRVRFTVVPLSFLLLFVLFRFNLGGGYNLFDPHWFSYAGSRIGLLVTVAIFGTLLIWRAISAGLQDNSFTSIYRRFVFGLVAIILVLIFWRFNGRQVASIWQSIGLEVLLFFGCGLLALAISNLERLRLELAQHQEATASFSRRWISMLIILVVAILVLGLLLTGVLSLDTGRSIVNVLGKLGNWLLTGFLYLLYPVGLVGQLFYWVMRWILALIRREPPPQQQEGDTGDPNRMFQQNVEAHLPVALVQTLKWGSIILVIALVVFFLSRLLSRYWKVKSDEGIEEVHETLGSWNLFKMDLRSFFDWLFQRFRRRAQVSEDAAILLRPEVSENEDNKLYTIREIYRGVLWEGRNEGTPRRSQETPFEYSQRLKQHRADLADELDTLTQAYVVERYGQINPEPEKVTWLNRVWRSMRNKFRNKDGEV